MSFVFSQLAKAYSFLLDKGDLMLTATGEEWVDHVQVVTYTLCDYVSDNIAM